MSDYISRQAAIDAIHNKMILVGSYLTDSSVGFEFAEDEINNLPSADVVPVVRCKDCKHCYFADNRVPDEQGWVCEINSSEPVNLNGFCSYGERKE